MITCLELINHIYNQYKPTPFLHLNTDHSMWALVQKVPPPLELDYSSIEELFYSPVKEKKDKGAAAPVKKSSKKVVNTRRRASELQHSKKAEQSMMYSKYLPFILHL